MTNPQWDFALTIYAHDEIASNCLALQDQFNMDVNQLLYAAWLAQTDRRLTPDHLAAIDASVSGWRDNVIRPLRALRRQLRGYPPAASVVERLKALELGAERQQHDLMYAFDGQSPALPRGTFPLRENLTLVAQFASPADQGWTTGIESLATLIPR